MNVPVVIFLYRRPELVRQLVGCLRMDRPNKIWLVADGPKGPDEEELCQQTRQAAEREISWPCELRRVYAGANLGLRRRLETGLDEVFAREPEAVVLEEDCHPTEDFYPFCSEMLAKYRKHPEVAGISGNCFLPRTTEMSTDYFYSRYLHIWGWATWARAWNSYDPRRWFWPEGGFRAYFPEAEEKESRYWNRIYSRVSTGKIQTWDYPWISYLWSRGWISITPSQNLVANRGFGPDATNTRDESVEVGIERIKTLRAPYRGPAGGIHADSSLDRQVFCNHYLQTEGRLPLVSRFLRSIRKRWQVV